MANIVRVETSSGPILIEVNSSDSAARQVSSAEDRITDAVDALSVGLDSLVAFTSDFADATRRLGKKVKKVEIEVGFELTGEGKFFFASASAGATFSAKIELDLTE